ncbi:MAG TPA: hypothetical protein VMT70_08170 [Vicinamibacteria bacterium]|nr:hypothetical protein [Vicinamibacteria bacterium]
MSAQPTLGQSPPQGLSRSTRVEYLDYQNLPDYREYRMAVRTPEGSAEFRLRIPIEAFSAKRVLVQDGPDVCYQKLLRTLAAGETLSPVVTIDDAELASYREAHTPTPRRASWTSASRPKPPSSRRTPLVPRPRLPVAVPPETGETAPAFDEGQRVSHTIFGVGVTMASSGSYTSVHFDDNGLRTFVTSLLNVEVLSAPHTWETGPRGKNRPRDRSPAESLAPAGPPLDGARPEDREPPAVVPRP